MRKIIFITSVFILISLSACNITEPNRIENARVTNKSSITPINFKTDGNTYSVSNAAGSSITIQTRWTDSVVLLNNPRATAKKYYDYAKGNALKIDFTDMTAYQFKIKNNAGVEVIVSEKNNLLGSTYGDKATVEAGAEQNVTFYTDKPDVTVDTDGNFTITIHDKVIIID